jgi:hypothetical protein
MRLLNSFKFFAINFKNANFLKFFFSLSTFGALSPTILSWTSELEALVEEELMKEYEEEVIPLQELIMDMLRIGSPTLPSPLKQE